MAVNGSGADSLGGDEPAEVQAVAQSSGMSAFERKNVSIPPKTTVQGNNLLKPHNSELAMVLSKPVIQGFHTMP